MSHEQLFNTGTTFAMAGNMYIYCNLREIPASLKYGLTPPPF
jgi:hypothetical protein